MKVVIAKSKARESTKPKFHDLPMLVSSCRIVYIATQHYCEPKKNKFQVTTSYSYLPNTADPQVALLGVAGGGVGVAEDNPLLILWGNH